MAFPIERDMRLVGIQAQILKHDGSLMLARGVVGSAGPS
jgi:hypothetical protein